MIYIDAEKVSHPQKIIMMKFEMTMAKQTKMYIYLTF
jgi:hypothetical protein